MARDWEHFLSFQLSGLDNQTRLTSVIVTLDSYLINVTLAHCFPLDIPLGKANHLK